MEIQSRGKPLYWADVLERDVGTMLVNRKQAAAELRRLHAENERLRQHLLNKSDQAFASDEQRRWLVP